MPATNCSWYVMGLRAQGHLLAMSSVHWPTTPNEEV